MASLADSTVVKRGFGGYTRHFWSTSIPKQPYNKMTWVNRRYTPIDLRGTMPVQAHKFIAKLPSNVHPCWVPRPEAPLQKHSMAGQSEGEKVCTYDPSTRTPEWSTLKQMLPSRGNYERTKPEKWGTSGELALPAVIQKRPGNFPKISSMMTGYVLYSPPQQ